MTDSAACGLALKFRKVESVGVLRDIFQILQKIVIFLSYLIIAKETDTDYTNSANERYCFAFLFVTSRARARNEKTYTARVETNRASMERIAARAAYPGERESGAACYDLDGHGVGVKQPTASVFKLKICILVDTICRLRRRERSKTWKPLPT